MVAKEFKEQNVIYGENQEQYQNLPAYVDEKCSTFNFELDDEEIKQVIETGEIFISVMNFNQPLQPIGPSVKNPFKEALNKRLIYRGLELKVIEWAKDKGILEKAATIKQAEKTKEETIELIDAIKANDPVEIKDALGDILVTIIIQAKLQNLDLLDCLNTAYDVISKRTGKMIGGEFIKDK